MLVIGRSISDADEIYACMPDPRSSCLNNAKFIAVVDDPPAQEGGKKKVDHKHKDEKRDDEPR